MFLRQSDRADNGDVSHAASSQKKIRNSFQLERALGWQQPHWKSSGIYKDLLRRNPQPSHSSMAETQRLLTKLETLNSQQNDSSTQSSELFNKRNSLRHRSLRRKETYSYRGLDMSVQRNYLSEEMFWEQEFSSLRASIVSLFSLLLELQCVGWCCVSLVFWRASFVDLW